ncbi:MAG: hypothetical protein ACRC9T_09420, partial [Vibrionaceae bacterium]
KIERVINTLDAGSSQVKEINKELAQALMLEVIAAEPVSDYELSVLEAKEELTQSEKAQSLSAKIRDFAKTDIIDEELFLFFDDGRAVKKTSYLERVIDGDFADLLERDTGKHISDKRFDFAVAKTLQEIVNLSGLLSDGAKLAGRIKPENEQAILDYMRQRQVMLACFGVLSQDYANGKKPIKCAKKAIKHAFARLGIEFKSVMIRRENGSNIRVLGVDSDKNSLLFSIVERRLAERAAAKRAAAAMAEKAANADSLEIDSSEPANEVHFEIAAVSIDERKADAQAVLEAYEFTDRAAKAYSDDYLLRAAVRLSESKHIFDVRAHLIEHDKFNDERFDSALYRLRLEDIEAFDPITGLFDEAI